MQPTFFLCLSGLLLPIPKDLWQMDSGEVQAHWPSDRIAHVMLDRICHIGVKSMAEIEDSHASPALFNSRQETC